MILRLLLNVNQLNTRKSVHEIILRNLQQQRTQNVDIDDGERWCFIKQQQQQHRQRQEVKQT